MDKFNQILKQVLIFLVIFLAVSYVFEFFGGNEDQADRSGELVFQTTENEYSRTDTVVLEIENNTEEAITIPNECPGEPFRVIHYENGKWIEKNSNPELNCSNSQDLKLSSGESTHISYANWDHALFWETGRFKVEFDTELGGEARTLETQEFTVVEEGIFSKLWNGIFYRPIYNGLIFLAKVIPGHNLALSIILLTLIIRTILLVPSQKALRSQKRMQEIQPRLEKIKEKHKGDQQRIAMETMNVWKEAKVSPVSSCLPLLLQFPFLIAVFHVIQSGLNPDNTYLLYTQYADFSLQDINTNFLGILDLTAANNYVLALIIGGLQFGQMKLTMARSGKNKSKKDLPKEMAMANNMMMYIMPVMISVFTFTLPAGVGIYWGASTLYGIGQQLVINFTSDKPDKDEPQVRVVESKKDKK